MSVSQILTTYDGAPTSLCIAGGGGGGGVVSVGAGAGLTITGGPTTNPVVNLGFTGVNQLLYGTGLNAGTLLGPGSPGDFLRINNAITPTLEWHPISAGGVVSVSANPNGACFVNNSNSSTPAVAIAFPAGDKGAIPGGNGTINQGAFNPGPLGDGSQQNYILTADNMSAVGFSWKAAAGAAITGEAPLVEFVDGTLSKVGINFGVGAAGIGQIPVGISDPQGKVGTLTPALTAAEDNYVLTASSADAATGGVIWKQLTGPGGAIGTNAPLVDTFVAPNNTISINFGVGAAGIGQIPVGISDPGGKVGTLTPALTSAQDNYVLTASSAAAAAGGVVWAPLPSAAGTIVNRAAAHLGPTPIAAPTSINQEMVLVAEEPIFEFWAASGTAAAAGILPPFTSPGLFGAKIFTTRAENILVGAVSTPAIVLLDTGTPVWSVWGGSIPASPAINGFFNSGNPNNMVMYGDFDNIGVYVAANVGSTTPEAYRPYNVVCFDADGGGNTQYDNQNRFSSATSKGIIGGPVICAAEGSIAFGNPCWVFGGSFNELEGIPLTPHNIVYISFFPIVPNIAQWGVPAGFGTNGPVYSLVYDNPNLFIGGDFTEYGAPPATAGSPYLYVYDLTTSVPTSLPTALTGFVLNMALSAVSASRLIVYGNPNGTGATGSRAVFIDTGTLAISASGLPPTSAVANYPLNKASRAITSGTLIVNPPAGATDTYDVIAIAGVIGDPIFVYIFATAIGSWENTGDVLTSLATNNPICMYYDATAAPSPVLFCQADAIQYEYNQLTATPTASFTLANGFLFNSNTATTTATMNANTSQYFIAGVNGTKWICSGALAPGLAFT